MAFKTAMPAWNGLHGQAVLFKVALLFPPRDAGFVFVAAGAIELLLVVCTARALVRWTECFQAGGQSGLTANGRRDPQLLAVICVNAEAADAESREVVTTVLAM